MHGYRSTKTRIWIKLVSYSPSWGFRKNPTKMVNECRTQLDVSKLSEERTPIKKVLDAKLAENRSGAVHI